MIVYVISVYNVHCAWWEARVCHAASTTSAADTETLQSRQNQAAHYSLLSLSVTSKELPAVSKPLGSNYWVQGKEKFVWNTQESL